MNAVITLATPIAILALMFEKLVAKLPAISFAFPATAGKLCVPFSRASVRMASKSCALIFPFENASETSAMLFPVFSAKIFSTGIPASVSLCHWSALILPLEFIFAIASTTFSSVSFVPSP